MCWMGLKTRIDHYSDDPCTMHILAQSVYLFATSIIQFSMFTVSKILANNYFDNMHCIIVMQCIKKDRQKSQTCTIIVDEKKIVKIKQNTMMYTEQYLMVCFFET